MIVKKLFVLRFSTWFPCFCTGVQPKHVSVYFSLADETAVHLISDEQLKELGLTALGHCIKFTDFFPKKRYEMTNDNHRKEKLEKLRSLIRASSLSRSRKGKTPLQSAAPTTKKQRVKENLLFEFGWKYWTNGRFQQKKMRDGGGNSGWDAPRYASLENCLEIAKGLLCPIGKTPVEDASSMSLALANYCSEVINDLLEGGEVCKS